MWKYLSRVVVRGEVRSSGEFEFGFGVADCQIFHHWRVIRPCLRISAIKDPPSKDVF